MSIEKLVQKLDIYDHIEKFKHFFSRDHSLYIEGDQELHFRYIKALDKLEFNAPPKSSSLDTIFVHLKKQGVLTFEQIFEIVKIVRYIRYFKNLKLEGILLEWMEKIVIDERFDEIDCYFDAKGNFVEELDEELHRYSAIIKEHKNSIAESLKRLMHSSKVAPYLIDTQVHYINNEECLLVRGGFNHVLKGAVVGRSSSGGFYVVPDAIHKTKEKIRSIDQEREAILYRYAKEFSNKLAGMLPFLKFIDHEFEKLDNYQARVKFAQSGDLSIVKAQKDDKIVLKNFIHPALSHPKPINVDFSKNVLMITGVNAGGKTMLLKSILASAFMAKYIIPMKIDANKSHIGSFKKIEAIIDDPQNVKNDISTFAGRMKQFSEIFKLTNALIGVDEIELGTDSDEAAALFKVILDNLIKKHQKIVITTHHKRLASLMADRDDVELMAAIYDEKARVPTYEFMQGIIGKSYAFETALRYGIGVDVVNEARKVYGDNSEKLNLLIERGSELERELKKKHQEVDRKLEALKRQEELLKEERFNLQKQLEQQQAKLHKEFSEAIEEAKRAAKGENPKEIHRAMNKAHKKLPKKEKKQSQKAYEFKVRDGVKYHNSTGVIIDLKGDNATIEVNGLKVRVKTKHLRPAQVVKAKPKANVKVNVEKKSGLKCDLHGMRSEEAIEVLDKFLSDALLDGWDEVIVYHGIGTGKLAYAVKEYLKRHPKVKSFEDAPANMGGYGAKVVHL